MKKNNNKIINWSLKILTILAFVLIFVPFNKAAAQYGGNITYCGTFNCENINYNNGYAPYYNGGISYYQTTPLYNNNTNTSASPTPVIYSNSTNPNGGKVLGASTKKIASSGINNTKDLVANAVYGSNSFLPSGLIQWILLAIFILIIVILSRRIFGGKEKYQATPLKHE